MFPRPRAQPGDPLKNPVPYNILATTGAGILSSITGRSITTGAPDIPSSSQSVITIGHPFRKDISLAQRRHRQQPRHT